MSINIDCFEVVKCTLEMHKDVLCEFAEGNYITVKQKKNNEVVADGLCEGFKFKAIEQGDNTLKIAHIGIWGEGSGHEIERFEKLLELTRGTLKAVVVWEGGYGVERLVVIDGKVSRTYPDIIQLFFPEELLDEN